MISAQDNPVIVEAGDPDVASLMLYPGDTAFAEGEAVLTHADGRVEVYPPGTTFAVRDLPHD